MKSLRILAALVAFLVASPAVAQWQVPNNAIPLGKGAGVTGFSSVAGSAGAGAKCLIDTTPPSFGACNSNDLGIIVAGSLAYPTIQSAFTAAMAASSSLVWLPCGTYNIGTAGSPATGLDIRNSRNIQVRGLDGPNGGAGQCVMVNYLGTGTAVTYGGSIGLEWSHTYMRTLTGSKFWDGTTGTATNTTYAYFHDNMSAGVTGTTIHHDIASGVGVRFARNAMAGGSIGIRGISGAGGIPAGQFAVSVTIGPANAFQPTLTVAAIQGMEAANVSDNIFQGQLLGYASGPAGTCQRLNWTSNWHGDAVAPQPLIQSNCRTLNSESNTYSQAGGTAIAQANSTGVVNSTSDLFSSGTWVAIGTGNLLNMKSQEVTGFAPVITGTPATNPVAQIVYGGLNVGTATAAPAAPLVVASRGSSVSSSGISVVASDYGTNGGSISINKNTGVGSAANIAAFDGTSIAPITFVSGDVRLGGVFSGNREGALRFLGLTSGTALIRAQSVAGTPDLRLPTGSGTFASSATAPLVLDATTGVLTCPTCSGLASTLTFGTHLTSGGASYDGSAPVTITSDATAVNTASTIMARDGAGQVAATTFTGALAGNATTATTATTATNAINSGITLDSASASNFLTFSAASSGNNPLKAASGITTNPSIPSIGVGGAAPTNSLLSVAGGTASLAGTTQFAFSLQPTCSSAATATCAGAYIAPSTANAAFTVPTFVGAYIDNGIKGAASTITTHYGLLIAAPTMGTTNYAIWSQGGTNRFTGQINFGAGNKLLFSPTAPTITGGTFCTTPSIPANNGTAAFTINVGSACGVSTGSLDMPAASVGWVCDFANVTNPATSVPSQTGGTATTVTLTNYVRTTGVAGNWTSSDVIRAKCSAY